MKRWRVSGVAVDGKATEVARFFFRWRAKRYIRQNPPMEPIPGRPLYDWLLERR